MSSTNALRDAEAISTVLYGDLYFAIVPRLRPEQLKKPGDLYYTDSQQHNEANLDPFQMMYLSRIKKTE